MLKNPPSNLLYLQVDRGQNHPAYSEYYLIRGSLSRSNSVGSASSLTQELAHWASACTQLCAFLSPYQLFAASGKHFAIVLCLMSQRPQTHSGVASQPSTSSPSRTRKTIVCRMQQVCFLKLKINRKALVILLQLSSNIGSLLHHQPCFNFH